jgi:hypothetical protein
VNRGHLPMKKVCHIHVNLGVAQANTQPCALEYLPPCLLIYMELVSLN